MINGRKSLVLGVAVAAVLFAAVGALGPAKPLHATYAWPPHTLPSSERPTRLWYSPLLLTRSRAAEIRATIPCRGLAPALPGSTGRRTPVLATMRHPFSAGGLAITRVRDRLTFWFGTAAFAAISLQPKPNGCDPVAFRLVGDAWTISRSSAHVAIGDFGGATPRVTGLFSGLDLRRGLKPEITVTTSRYGVAPRWWQWPAWTAGVALAFAALILAFGRPRAAAGRRRGVIRSVARPIRRRFRPIDAVVAVLLLTWWVVGPVLYDDGWVKARQTNGLVGSGFSNYYTSYGVNLPLDFWSEWFQQWVVAHSSTLLIERLPTLVVLACTWMVCRSILARLFRETRSSSAEWALGFAFSLNALAWGVTLRPEPIVALLLVSVLALSMRFSEQPSGWLLASAGALVALAIAAHPAGFITLAPLLALGPHVVTWARTSGWLATGVVGTAVFAILMVVLTVGSDAQQRASEASLIRTSGDATASWRDELTRYLFVGAEATTLRRASVALMLAALVAYLARRRGPSRFDLPGTSLALALILLIPTPSKWSWHFGALIGLAALVVAAEVARLRAEGKELHWPVRPLAAYGAAVLVVAWALFPRVDWSTEFGLRTLSWTFAFEKHVTLVRLALVGFALIFAGALLVGLLRRGLWGAWRAPWALVPILVPLVVLPLIVWNVGMFVADTFKTPGWTLARQNVESINGDAGCGLADDTTVAAPGSIRSLVPLNARAAPVEPRWLSNAAPPTPLAFSLFERENQTRVTLPWFRVPDGERAGFYVLSAFESSDRIDARWGKVEKRDVGPDHWGGAEVSDFGRAHAGVMPWSFVPQGELPGRSPGADAVQLALASYGRPPHALAATGAVAYRPTALSSLFRMPGARPLVWPNLLLYMPCAHLPRLDRGVVEVPTVIVAHSDLIAIERETAPFHGLVDLYQLRDLGVADSKVDPNRIKVLWVNRHIPGAAVAPAVAGHA